MSRLTTKERLRIKGVNLNENQFKSVKCLEGGSLIQAGPGTGKTSTLCGKVIFAKIVNPCANILVISFTKKATAELESRLSGVGGMVSVSTFHSFFYKILRDYGFRAYKFLENDNQKALIIKNIIKNLNANVTAEEVTNAITKCSFKSENIEKVFRAYLEFLRNHKLLEFDALQYFLLDLISRYPLIARRVREKYDFVLIDESQDISLIQYRIITEIWKAGDNISFYGDSRQAIYSFRGSQPRVLDDLKRHFKARVFNLNLSYRCSSQILEVAEAILPGAEKLESVGNANSSISPIFRAFNTPMAEANAIIDKIRELRTEGHHYRDISILFRNSSSVSLLYEKLVEAGLPFIKVGSDPLRWNNSRNKVFLAMLALLHDKHNNHYFNCCKKVFSKDTDEFYAFIALNPLEFSMRDLSIHLWNTWLKAYWQVTDDDILDDWLILIQDYTSFDAMQEHILKLRKQERKMAKLAATPNADYFKMISIHSAKGLEFENVLMVGMSDDVLPCTGHEDIDIEEERRIAFVGVTRAKNLLWVSYAKTDPKANKLNLPSRFFSKFF